METMHFHIAQNVFRTTSFRILVCVGGGGGGGEWVPMKNMATMNNCPGVHGKSKLDAGV